MKQLVDYVDSNDETINQKINIILNHFTPSTSKKIKGRGEEW